MIECASCTSKLLFTLVHYSLLLFTLARHCCASLRLLLSLCLCASDSFVLFFHLFLSLSLSLPVWACVSVPAPDEHGHCKHECGGSMVKPSTAFGRDASKSRGWARHGSLRRVRGWWRSVCRIKHTWKHSHAHLRTHDPECMSR